MESSNSIDLKVISCKGLKSFNFFQKLSVYSAVSLGTSDADKSQRQQRQKTPVDQHGNRNPEWNHEIRFDLVPIPLLQRKDLFLHFDLFSDGIFADKLLGEVHVPLTDLVRDFDDAVRFVSYQIRTPDRKNNGILNFSYKVNSSSKGKIASYPTVDTSPAVLIPAKETPPGGYFAPPSPLPAHFHPPLVQVPCHLPSAPMPYYIPPGPVGFGMSPPDPYGYRPGGFGYGSYGYPTAGVGRPYEGDTWRGGF